MGYQESLITTQNPEDFDKLVKRVKELGESFYSEYGCSVPFVITLKKKIDISYEPFAYEKGTSFLYAAGDRALQYRASNFVNRYRPAQSKGDGWSAGGFEEGEDIALDFVPDILYCDELPDGFYDEGGIHAGMETDIAIVEKFSFE